MLLDIEWENHSYVHVNATKLLIGTYLGTPPRFEMSPPRPPYSLDGLGVPRLANLHDPDHVRRPEGAGLRHPKAIQPHSSEGSCEKATAGTGSVHSVGISAEHGALCITVIGELAHPAATSISGSIAIRRMTDFLFGLSDDGGGGLIASVGFVADRAGVLRSGRAVLD